MPEPMRATVSLRISTFLWEHPERRAELLDLLRAQRRLIDEVAFFTSFTHPPLPLGVIEQRAQSLQRIMPGFRALGMRAGINHLSILGHHEENMPNSLNEPWQRVVGADGATCEGTFCAADPRMREYIRQSCIALAEAGPDFLWIDDDVRMEGHGAARFICFCDLCMGDFAEETGSPWTRETLISALNGGSRDQRLEVRRKWLDHNRGYIDRVLRTVRQAVDEVNPDLVLGEMTGEMSYSGYGFDRWARTLAGKRELPVKWRPGGGFYTDDPMGELLNKTHTIGRQTAQLPATVREVQYEHENFPYQPLRKSMRAFTAEIAAAIGAGCTGVALNCMGITQDPFPEYRPYFDAVARNRRFYDRCVAAFERGACEGIWPAFGRDHVAALSPDGDWFTAPHWGGDFGVFRELAEIGLPSAYGAAGSVVTLLSGDTVVEFSREELLKLLAGSVVMDGPALARLSDAGLAEHAGFRIARTVDRDMIEVLTDDPLNYQWAGRHRDCRPSFWRETAYLLEPIAGSARPLSEITDFTPTTLGIGSGIFENSLGGRIAVLGHYPWRSLSGLSASSNTKALYRWVSRDRLPAYVASYHRAALWCRRDPEGRLAMLLLNASLDAQPHIKVHALTDATALRAVWEGGRTVDVPRTATDGPYSAFAVGSVGPWNAVLLTIG